MNRKSYDIVTIGGGLAGASLAKVMAERGANVLVLESETEFKDRVRGESMMPWGVAEARELGIYDTIMASGGHELPWWDVYQGPERTTHRNLPQTTQCGLPAISFYHPTVQGALIQSARDAGAEVHRGARVTGLELNGTPTVRFRLDGHETEIGARLIVGADGRNSMVRSSAGFEVQRDKVQNLIAGVLFEDMDVPDDTNHIWPNPTIGKLTLLFPLGGGWVRAYGVVQSSHGVRLNGSNDMPVFVETAMETGAPKEYYAGARQAGPLATFAGAGTWVEHPYDKGVVLIGDAAAHSDPSWGQGLSLTLRDVRVLRDQLLRSEDWDEAGHAYAEEQPRYFNVTHTVESWMDELLYTVGPEGDALREKVFPQWAQDPTRSTDVLFSGPNIELDDTTRRRFFGEE